MNPPSGTPVQVGEYRYGYQGEYAEDEQKEAGIQTNSFQLRLYNPRLGRWLSPDPYGQFHSPYLAMGNNPMSKVDPDGGNTTVPITGRKKNVKTLLSQINEVTGGDYEVIDDNLEAIDGKYGDKPASSYFKEAIEKPYDIPMRAVRSFMVNFDSFEGTTVDVGDISKASTTIKSTIYVHFLAERIAAGPQYSDKAFRKKATSDEYETEMFDKYHEAGLDAETLVLKKILKLKNIHNRISTPLNSSKSKVLHDYGGFSYKVIYDIGRNKYREVKKVK